MNALDGVVYSRPFGRLVLAPIARSGLRRYRRDGTTPTYAYRAMRKLYGCASTDPFERLTADAVDVAGAGTAPVAGTLEGIAGDEVEGIVRTLRSDGFAVLERRLAEDQCAELEATAREAACTLVGARTPALEGTAARFDPDAPQALRYDVPEEVIAAIPAAQRLIADPSLFAVARQYLGATPIQDLVAMWWSAARSNPSSGEGAEAEGRTAEDAAAQQFHFDLDRLRFLKVFVFLTDVDADTGPHVYVRGSHRRKPPALRRDGRHADAAIEEAFPDAEVQITGPRGTVFLADTIGLHKGMPLRRGHRLVFQTEYTTSLFGGPYTTPSVVQPSDQLVAAASAHPESFRRFRLS